MRVLIVKLSSLGDLVHALPALTDARKHHPDIVFDWVVEDSFAEIPSWHPSVNRLIPIHLRRWRKEKWRCLLNGEFRAFVKALRREHYDLVIDAQSSLKSALVTRLARGTRCGFSFGTTRERFASLFYQKKYPVIFEQHAIRRLRQLFAAIFNYIFVDDTPDYGLTDVHFPPPADALPPRFLIFFHNTTWTTKLYPEKYWEALILLAAKADFHVLLPWGNPIEKARATRLAKTHAKAQVLPRLSLSAMAGVILRAQACICCDTGLGHVTAALDIPAVSLYGPTNPEWIGAIGKRQRHLQADFACAPCRQKKCTYRGKAAVFPACFTRLPPELVWQTLESLL